MTLERVNRKLAGAGNGAGKEKARAIPTHTGLTTNGLSSVVTSHKSGIAHGRERMEGEIMNRAICFPAFFAQFWRQQWCSSGGMYPGQALH